MLCVPFRTQAETLTGLRDTLREGQLVVDATVPLAVGVGGRATRTVGVWQGSAAEQAQELVPRGVTVVSALHTVSAATLADLDREDQTTAARVLELRAAPPADGGHVIAFDQMGPHGLRPTAGAGWAPRKRPERQRASYHRRHGSRYAFGPPRAG